MVFGQEKSVLYLGSNQLKLMIGEKCLEFPFPFAFKAFFARDLERK